MIFFNVRETRLYFLNSSEFLARKIVLFCCVLLLTESKTSKFNLKHTNHKNSKGYSLYFLFFFFRYIFYEGVYPCQNCFICFHKVYDKVNDVLCSFKSRFFYRQRKYFCYHVTYSRNSNNTDENERY